MDKVTKIQEIRRSNAATAIPSRKTRKNGGRQGEKRNALRNEYRAG